MPTAKALFLTSGGHARIGDGANQAILEEVLAGAGLDPTIVPDPSGITPERLGACDVIVDYSGHAQAEPTEWEQNEYFDFF